MEGHLLNATPKEMVEAGYGIVVWFDKKIVIACASQRAVAKYLGVKVHVIMYALKEKKKVQFKNFDVAVRIMNKDQMSLIADKDVSVFDERFVKTPYTLTELV